MAKTHSRDYLKRLGAVILLIKSWCLLQNVIYPPPELEAFNVDHKLGRTSGSKDTSAKQQNKSQLFVLAPKGLGDNIGFLFKCNVGLEPDT